MNFRNIIALLASSAIASADDIFLVAKSNSSDINGNSLAFIHEGAGINYGFLSTASEGTSFTYDANNETLSTSESGFLQYFRVSGGYVASSVEGPDAALTFSSNDYLLVNGTSDYFYACKNTNDPYRFSSNGYEVMYYPQNAPSDCLPLILQKKAASSSSSSSSDSSSIITSTFSNTSTPITTTTLSTSASTFTNSYINSTTTYTGAAVHYGPVGSFAALFGLAAALI